MATWISATLVWLALGADGPPPVSAADAVTLKDGQIAFGQVVEPAPRGKVLLVIRREWAARHLADWFKRWEATEKTWAPRARRERRERLQAWRRELGQAAQPNQTLTSWLDAEIDRLADHKGQSESSPLMAVQVSRGEVRKIDKRSEANQRLLRLGWRAGFADVESMAVDDLKGGLEGRGFAVNGDDLAAVDDLLPVMPEPEPKWQIRRAATEVTLDSSQRFIRYNNLILPEASGGGMPGAGPGDALAALSSMLKELVDDRPPQDPLAAKLNELAAKGKSGIVLTRLDLPADLSQVTVESVFWVRRAMNRWEPVAKRTETVRPQDVPKQEGAPLAEDPQVKAAFGIVEALGLGQVAPEIKERSLKMGAAAQRALAMARAAIDKDLQQAAFKIEAPAQPAQKEEPKPEAKS
jgi:hypothetical protein